MATKLARRIVESESPIAMTEAFLGAMRERTSTVFKGLKEQKAKYVLFENPSLVDYDEKLDAAVNFVMEKVQVQGIDSISEVIVEAAPIYKVTEKDLRNVFEDAIADPNPGLTEEAQPTFEDFQKSFLLSLDRLIENNSGNVLGFQDLTSAYVTPEEGRALLELYSNLNTGNKQKMVESLVSGKKEFERLVKFAGGVIN
jgi:hypothetical protein